MTHFQVKFPKTLLFYKIIFIPFGGSSLTFFFFFFFLEKKKVKLDPPKGINIILENKSFRKFNLKMSHSTFFLYSTKF